MLTTLLEIVHIGVCVFLMLVVLLQQGKGGGMGAAFGGGNAATVFVGSGASSFLRRLTAGAGDLPQIAAPGKHNRVPIRRHGWEPRQRDVCRCRRRGDQD